VGVRGGMSHGQKTKAPKCGAEWTFLAEIDGGSRAATNDEWMVVQKRPGMRLKVGDSVLVGSMAYRNCPAGKYYRVPHHSMDPRVLVDHNSCRLRGAHYHR
jgi:hypothetical protein